MQHWLRIGLIMIAQLGSVVVAHAQQGAAASAPASGYVVDLKGDTLRGSLTIPRFATALGVQWQPAAGAARTLNPADCRALGHAAGPRFVVHRVRLSVVSAGSSREDSSAVFLQSLVQGQTNLYRFDYNALSQRTALDNSLYENTFYWVQLAPNAPLQLLSEGTFRTTLVPLLQGCEQLKPLLSHARFRESDLVGLVLAFNRTCAPAVPTVDWRPAAVARTRRETHMGVSGGYQLVQVYYPETDLLSANNMQAQGGLNGGLVLTAHRPKERIELETGLNVAILRSRFANTYTVPAGYANTGQKFERVQLLQIARLQLPVLATVQLGRSSWTPWLSFGPALGVLFSQKSTVEVLRETFRLGEFLPRLEARTQALEGQAVGTTLCLGGILGVGVRPQIGRLQALGRVQYEFSQQVANVTLGALRLRGWSFTGGVLF